VDRIIRIATALIVLAALAMAPASADVTHDEVNGFFARAALPDGYEVEVHVFTDGSQTYDGIPLRNVGGKGGWGIYVEIRKDGVRLESGGANDGPNGDFGNVSFSVDELDSGSMHGTVYSEIGPLEIPSTMEIHVDVTGTGNAEPTLFPYRYLNPHRVEAGAGIEWQRPIVGTMNVTSVLGVFNGSVTDGRLVAFDRLFAGENVIDPDRE
jgi:hypothetical protein